MLGSSATAGEIFKALLVHVASWERNPYLTNECMP